MSAKILTLDIETSPNLAHVWGLWNQNIAINQLVASTEMLSFAAKWYGKPRVMFYSQFHHGHEQMVQAAHDLLSEADIVVHFNGKSFDMPHLRREFLAAGLNPPAPVKEVDLCLVAKKQFRFTSNKLDYITQYLGLSGKIHHSGFDLWRKCMAGDAKAWAEMRRYNMQDVRTTEELYDKLLPWVPNHPHLGLYVADGDERNHCQNCGGTDLRLEGYAYTNLGKYQRFQCKNPRCGKWGRSKRAVAYVDVRAVS